MGFFKNIASPLIARGIPVIPLRSKSKDPFLDHWQDLASIDPIQIDKWDKEYPNANCASVAQSKIGGFWFWEIDSPEAIQRMGAETGKELPATFTARSSPGRGHVYWLQNEASIKQLGNIAQGFVKGGDWSARVDRAYVVSPGSLHPTSGGVYEIRSNAEIIEAPLWFIEWLNSQKIEKKTAIGDDGGPIAEGGRNTRLTSIGGKLREAGLDYEAILEALLKINLVRCQPPLPEAEIIIIAGSVSRYAPGKDDTVLIGGKIAGSATPSISSLMTGITEAAEAEEIIDIVPVSYPKFPYWVMNGTSIYEGLVKPFCDINTRYPEFMFMAAMTIMLNYLGTKIRIAEKNLMPTIFLAIIGRRGITFKSSSVNDAIIYFEQMGFVGQGDFNTRNAEGRALIFDAGSPEGFGKEMARLMCKNGILFYDELRKLVNKASIDSSSLTSVLLSMYEAGKFQNIVKSAKDSFSLLPGTYCASLIVCSTDRNFLQDWSKLSGDSSGLDDRFYFLMQPEVLKPLVPYTHVYTQEATARTKELIEKAIAKNVYEISNKVPLGRFSQENEDNNRAEIRAEKFALGFAVDLGLDEIDEDCIERGLALSRYEQAAKKYLLMYDADTREGSIQQEIMHHLQQYKGDISLRDLERLMHSSRFGTTLWMQALRGLVQYGLCRLEGKGTRGSPQRLIVIRFPDQDD